MTAVLSLEEVCVGADGEKLFGDCWVDVVQVRCGDVRVGYDLSSSLCDIGTGFDEELGLGYVCY